MTKVLVLGATGAVGLPLCQKLSSLGFKVVGTGASGRNFDTLAKVAKPITMNILHRESVEKTVREEQSDVVINCTSKLPGWIKAWKPESDFVANNAIRAHGTAHLIQSMKKYNPKSSLISLSHANCGAPINQLQINTLVPDSGAEVLKHGLGIDDPEGRLSDENSIRCLNTLASTSLTIAADEYPFVDHKVPLLAMFNQSQYRMERLTRTFGPMSCVLRLGLLYGPGTTFAEGGEFYAKAKSGSVQLLQPAVGKWSLLHVDDAVSAIVAVVTKDTFRGGNYNVVTTPDGIPLGEWLSRYGDHIGAPKPSAASLRLAKYISPHMLHLCLAQRPADPGVFSSVYSWQATGPPIWEA